MDKLRHIDDLLRSSLGNGNYAADVSSDDWLAIAKKLKQRKDRIYAMWFSLALIAMLSVGVLWAPLSNEVPSVAEEKFNIENTQPELELPEIIEEEIEPIAQDRGQALQELVNTESSSTDGRLLVIEQQTLYDDVVELEEDQVDKEITNEATQIEPSFADLLAIVEVEIPQMKYADPEWSEVKDINEGNIIPKSLRSTAWWELGVSFTPTLSNKNLSADGQWGGLIHQRFFDIVQSSESAGFSTDQHIHLDRHFAGGFYIGFGLGWTKQTESIDYNYTITDAPQLNATQTAIDGYFELNPLAYVDINHRGSNVYHFLDIPLKAGYRQQLSPRWQLRHEVRGSYMLLTNTLGKKADYTYLELRDLDELTFFKKSNFAASVRSGLYYNIKNFVIGAEPVFGMNLGSITDNSSAVDIRPYTYGFNLSTKIILGKN